MSATRYPQAVTTFGHYADYGSALTLDAEAVHQAYRYGWCGLYALALIERHPQWHVVAHGTPCTRPTFDCGDYGGGLCACGAHHLYAVDPDGHYHDIAGSHPAPDGHLTVLTDAQLVALTTDWYQPYSSSLDGAATARTLTSSLQLTAATL